MKRIVGLLISMALIGCASLPNRKSPEQVVENYMIKIQKNVETKGQILKYQTNFHDKQFEVWAGNLYAENEYKDHVEFKGKGKWAFINKPNDIEFGTDIYFIMKLSADIQFNTALTRGFWDNDKEDIKIQMGMCETADSSDLISINAVEGKDSVPMIRRWKEKKFNAVPGELYLVHYEIDSEGATSMTIYNPDMKVNKCYWPSNLPKTEYSYEFTVNNGILSLYTYQEYTK